ncbi:MAG TPA: response regulator [Casimicrobiaceae bacterium]|nr:response regulator [Casimicrobiaceae bacterium]
MNTQLSPKAAAAAGARTRVLVVDDSPSFRRMVRYVLNQGGYEVTEAGDANEAMAAVQRSSFDLVLTDQNLPGTDGLHLIRNLRGTAQCAQVPILMLTTESSGEMKAAGRAAGATGWMVKPFDPVHLLDLVHQVVR